MAGDADDVVADEGGTFARAFGGGFQRVFPLEDGPAGVVVLSEFAEDAAEIDLSGSGCAEAAGAVDPGLVAAVDAAATVGLELGVFDVEGADAGVVVVEEKDRVHLLQEHVAGVIENRRAGVVVDGAEESLKGDAVVKVFAGVKLEAEIDAGIVEGVEDGQPAAGKLGECLFDEAGWALRPGVEKGPGERAGKAGVGGEAEVAAGARGKLKLGDGPALAFGGTAMQGDGRKGVKEWVVGGVDGDELTLEVSGQFADDQIVRGEPGAEIVAVAGAFGGLGEIEDMRQPGG